MKLLIVEDEKNIARYLCKGLTEQGFVIDLADSGDDGLHAARSGDYDLVILDVMLPGRDGWSVIAELRQAGWHTPLLFLTARDAVEDRVRGLELGAEQASVCGGVPSGHRILAGGVFAADPFARRTAVPGP